MDGARTKKVGRQEEDDKLERLVELKWPYAKIAVEMGRSVSMIAGRISRLRNSIDRPLSDRQVHFEQPVRGNDEKFLELLQRHHANQLEARRNHDDGYVR